MVYGELSEKKSVDTENFINSPNKKYIYKKLLHLTVRIRAIPSDFVDSVLRVSYLVLPKFTMSSFGVHKGVTPRPTYDENDSAIGTL